MKIVEQRMLNLALAGLQIGVGFYDKAGQLVTCNNEFSRLKRTYLLDDHMLNHVIREGKGEQSLVKGAGGMVLETMVAPYNDEAGEPAGYVCRLHNVTSEQAPEKDRELEAIFLDNVSHEVRTPLNAIIGFNDILNGVSGQHMEEDEKLMIKDHIHRNAHRLMTVVDDILDLSKMQKGSLMLHKTVASLMEICCKARDAVKHEVHPGVKLLHEYPVALRDTYLYTDAKRLEQLLRNMLTNACQHTQTGAVTLKVKALEAEGGRRPSLQIRVDDTGEGISLEQQSLLFRPFRKQDSKEEGLGVGLAICKEIARLLRGRVYMDQNYTIGASFVFEMPLEEI